jgi:hypothetical protein
LLLLLAIVLPANWTWRAWLILGLPLAVAGCFLLLQLLFSNSSELDSVGHFLVTVAIAWTSVWLVGRWLPHGGPGRAACVAWGVMLAVGVVGYVGYCGFWFSSEVTWGLLGFWTAFTLPLATALALTGICCRGHLTLPQLLLWPLLWIPATCLVCGVILFAITLGLVDGFGDGLMGAGMVLMAMFQVLIVMPFLSALLYILYAPVAVLCAVDACYGERFRNAFCRVRDREPQELEPVGARWFDAVSEIENSPGKLGDASSAASEV